jgi:translation initiation factor 2 subunit 3
MVNLSTQTQKTKTKESVIPEVNIGLVGHVDHGKTSLTEALTGKWTDTHSEEVKRGITIRLGYADVTFYKCGKCGKYSNSHICQSCFEPASPSRGVSFLDAPGHETLMATVLSGAALMDGALLLIAADEECPQPQTAEHLKVLDIAGIRKIVIVQNKIDLVSEEQAKKHYEQIKRFVKGTVAENAPIIPISAIHNANIDILIETIEKTITTPERDLTKAPRFFVARSFDVNKPGTAIKDLKGAVMGGSLTQGVLKAGDEIEIRPGIKINEKWTPIRTTIAEVFQVNQSTKEAKPGGLAALQTELDPTLSRGDGLSGSVVGHPDKLPPLHAELKLKIELFDYVIGAEGHQKVPQIKIGDPLLLTAGIAKTVGVVTLAKKTEVEAKLKIPVCGDKGDRVSMSLQIGGRWHLIGYGIIA